MHNEPTPPQGRVLDYICREVDARGSAPTYREISSEFGWHSPKAAVDHVEALARKGYVRLHRGRARGIEVLLNQAATEEDVVSVPIRGVVAAGRATAETEVGMGQVRVDRQLLGQAAGKHLFALRVAGDSMTGRGVHEGDIAVAEAGASSHIGDIVVALIDQESTLKTLARGADGDFLKAENPSYPDLFPLTEMAIQGVVRAVIRKVG